MIDGTAPEARAHHFVPQCWLAGFTDTGKKDGRLWATDFKRRKQWPSTPPNIGHRRDFYRVSDPKTDPLIVEKIFSKIEDGIAPILKAMDEGRRGPTREELEALLFFIAFSGAEYPRSDQKSKQ
jgi:hypothetical protein